MPFRETYEITSQEEGKAAQRDQSYKSCIIALLIFFFLCLIFIVACIPWKIQNLTDDTYNRDQHIGQESQYGKQTKQVAVLSTTQITPIMITAITAKTTKRYINTVPEKYTWDIQDITEKIIELSSQNSITKDEIITPPVIVSKEKIDHYTTTTKEIFQYTKNTEDIDSTITQHNIIIDNIIDNDLTSTSPNTQMVHTTTIKNHIADVIDPVTNPKSIEENTINDFSAAYTITKSEFVIENSTDFDKFGTAKINTITETIISSITPNNFTDFKQNTNTYTSDKNNQENLQFNTSINNLTSTSPIRTVFEENRNIEEYKYPNYKESTISESDNKTITRETSSTTEEYILSINKKKTEALTSNTNNYVTEKYDKQRNNVISESTEKYNLFPTNNYTNTIISSPFYNDITTTIISENQDKMHISTTKEIRLPSKNITICETGRCKQIASRILSYMNHSADPCEDFYEYACGSFEANPQLIDKEMVSRSRNYQRIARQMLKREYENSTFAMYYDSCVRYEKIMNFSERVKIANNTLNKIGEFYTSATWSNESVNFTDLFTQLILHHSALLFDIVPVLDEYSPNNYTLKIGPVMYEGSFMREHVEDPCSEDESMFETEEYYVDLQVLYNNYKRCKNDTTELMKSIREALIVLFKNMNDNYLEWHVQLEESIEKTIQVIDSIIMQGYFSQFLFENEIREKYPTNNYNKISLKELENSCTFINWTQLINSLGIHKINEHVYVHTTLIENLQKLEKFSKEDPMSLNNAIIGLYAYKLYHELVIPRRYNIKDYCLQVAVYLLRLEASSLYISSFTDHEIIKINKIIEDTFNELKQTLKLEMQKALWIMEEERELLLEKIDSLELALPAVSYFQNRDSLYDGYNMSHIFLHDNYFNNSIILLKRYRTLMYAELKGQLDDPKQIWIYYATPFQSQAQAIYNLNLNVIPYGIIDWSLMNNEFSFNYFVLATLGNLIAQQIAHHFDTNGWNHIKHSQDILTYQESFSNVNFEDYVDCQKNSLYQESMNIMLPFSNQIISYTIPQSTLNERLSDIMGLRLAYDTLVRTISDAENRLPWMKFRTEQLFYLIYAQMYCTKKPLTSSYISLYKNGNLPGRIRVFVSASNNKPLAEMWNCAKGSQVAPTDVCNIFPYLDFKENFLTPQ